MSDLLTVRYLSRFAIGFLAAAVFAAPVHAQYTFENNSPITIPDIGTANPYPSNITVSGYTGTITGITVTLRGLTHTWTDDLAALFVGPANQSTILFNGPGRVDAPGTSVTNVNLTFDDTTTNTTLPDESNFGSGTYKPGQDQYITASLAAPAPSRPYGNTFASLIGQAPDGTYSLYIEDFEDPDGGSLSGWSITLQGITPVPEPATVLGGPALLLAVLGWRRRCRAARAAATPV